jgi:cytochrome c oxidase subunit 3
MKIGVAEPVKDIEPPKRKKSRRSGGSSNRPSGGNNGGGSGGDGGPSGGGGFDRPQADEPRDQAPPDKAKVVTWFLLIVVLMTFGGLAGAYVVIATNRVAEWRPFELPIQVWMSTALIVASSLTYHIAQKAIFANDHQRLRRFLIITTVLGAAFISSQIIVWLELVNRGYYLSGNPYAGFFYIITGIHAVHVLGGVIALGAIITRSSTQTEFGPELEYRRNLARAVGWYWHFIGILWIALFAMLGFWK